MPLCFIAAVSMTVRVFTLVALLTRVKARFFVPQTGTQDTFTDSRIMHLPLCHLAAMML